MEVTDYRTPHPYLAKRSWVMPHYMIFFCFRFRWVTVNI